MSCASILQRYQESNPNIVEQTFDCSADVIEDDSSCSRQPAMTSKELKRIALEHNGYATPSLNDKLYLHFKGYAKIENLEEYTGLNALFLEANGLSTIQGLDQLHKLRCLYLQKNLISTIKGLDQLQSLVQLDLSENRITKLEGLSSLPNLSTLNVSKNALSDVASISHLKECKAIAVVDLSHNKITTCSTCSGEGNDDNIVDVLSQCQGIAALNMEGNPVVSEISHFRKKLIVSLRGLKFLDRPVFDKERATAEAWATGGRDAEAKTKKEWQQQERDAERKGMDDFRKWQADIRFEAQRKQDNSNDIDLPHESEERYTKKQQRLEEAKKEAEKEKRKYALSTNEKKDATNEDANGDVHVNVDVEPNASDQGIIDTTTDVHVGAGKEIQEVEASTCTNQSKDPTQDTSELAVSENKREDNDDICDDEDNEPPQIDLSRSTSTTEKCKAVIEDVIIPETKSSELLDDGQKALIEESLQILRSEKEAEEAAPARSTSVEEEEQLPWTEDMDESLRTLVHSSAFDFEQ
mmetsp:Transcript_23082/g.48049  ORF Transcript_23082/g.48049 Transcript_23082/m.48049 type:complete len:525 (-) Transcript_23082:273-1847(-)